MRAILYDMTARRPTVLM